MSRPKGSKNQPKLIDTPRIRENKVLAIPRECLKIIHDRARGSGLTPQMVLEDLIWAGNYTMGETYDNFTNYRRRMREKSINREHANPIRTLQTSDEYGPAELDIAETGQNGFAGDAPVQAGFLDVAGQRGHRPEDNPAFGDSSLVGDVTGVGITPNLHAVEDYPDQGPVPTDEEGNPIEPQEAQESFEQYE